MGNTVSSNWSVGQELHIGLEFDSKKEVQNALKQYLMNVHQTMKVLESKSSRYVVHPEYATPWTPTSFTVVPEPSSGVLLLVASAMLALRRRKMTENG